MRAVLVLAVVLAGCASHEYSETPEPRGEWVAANPPAVTQPPLRASARRQVGWGRR